MKNKYSNEIKEVSYRRKKIAYLVSCYPSVSHTFITREIKSLRKEGYQVDSYSMNEPIGPFKKNSDESYDLKTTKVLKRNLLLNTIKSMVTLKYNKSYIKESLKYLFDTNGSKIKKIGHIIESLIFARYIEKSNIKLIHVHFSNPAARVALLSSKLTNIPWSLSIHGPDSLEDITKFDIKKHVEEAKFVRVISRYAYNQIIRHVGFSYIQKTHIVRCGVECGPVKSIDKENKIFRGCTVGRLVSAKGHYFLLKAIKKCKENGINIRWDFIGDGPQRQVLTQLAKSLHISQQVKFLGAKDREKAFDYIKQCDVFALTSLAEGIPVSLMEAMSLKKPVISTKINGIPELIQDSISGLLCDPANIDDIYQGLRKLYYNESLRKKMGEKALLKVRSEYDMNLNGEKMARLIEKYIEIKKVTNTIKIKVAS